MTDNERAGEVEEQATASLVKACRALEKDHTFLLAGGVLDEGLIADWIAHNLNEETYQVCNRPHPYETALYFGV